MSGPPDSNLDEARGWLAQASEDLDTADRLSKDSDLLLESSAFWHTWLRKRR